MGSTGTGILFCCVALSMVAVGSVAAGSSTGAGTQPKYISADALKASKLNGTGEHRKLAGFQVLCPVRFDKQTAKIDAVGNSCRGPAPSEARCCGALKAFACPYTEYLNDNAINGCASQMFWDIQTRCKLSPGLFSFLCHDGPAGLSC
ncbi:hypothetical protein ACP4OV_004461 [Aristida adscensionis]